MRIHTRLLLSAFVAALALSASISTAYGRRIQLSNQTFRVVWSGANKLTFAEEANGSTVVCEVTIEGSFHSRTLSKVCGQLIGYVTRARVTRPCEGGEAWTLDGVERATQTLPWHIRYRNFSGTLPRIELIGVQLIGTAFLVLIGPVGCLYKSTVAQPSEGNINVDPLTGTVTTIDALNISSIPLFQDLTGLRLCPEQGFLRGTGSATVQNSTTRITVRLVQ
jgi:hypothetical protein